MGMGLDLMKKIFILTSVLILLSCNKGHETSGDFGEEVSVDAVNAVFSKAVKDIDPNKIKVGESVTHIVNLRVENSERFKPTFWGRTTILSRVNTNDALVFNVKTEEKDMSYDPPEEKVYEDEMRFSKANAINQINSELTVNFSKASNNAVQTMASEGKPVNTKYYNLKNYEVVLDLPEAVRNRPNCLGINNCKMNIHHLEFDEVNWYKSGAVKKVRWTYEVSPDVPYLAAMTMVCAAQLIDYEGSKVYVRNCRYAVDFNF